MLPFVPEFSFLDQTLDPPSRMPGASEQNASSSVSSLAHSQAIFSVTHIVDGDTIDVRDAAGHTMRVRFVGIDTPETVAPDRPVQCEGPEASARMKSLLSGKTVTLEKKPDEDTDKFGRSLRYVYLDGVDVGAQMISEGYAKSICKKFPHPKCSLYEELQQKAMSAHVGEWGACVK